MIKKFEHRLVLKAYRIALGITQERLGDAIGRSGATISMYEHGKIDGMDFSSAAYAFLAGELLSKPDVEFYDMKAAMVIYELFKQEYGYVPKDGIAVLKHHCRKFLQKKEAKS